MNGRVLLSKESRAFATTPLTLLPAASNNMTPQERKIRTAIRNLDLTLMRKRVMQPRSHGGCGWSLKKALEYEDQYRGFLFVKWKYPKKINIPTRNIDEYWHAHILYTKKYFKDCDRIFGKYQHHNPF